MSGPAARIPIILNARAGLTAADAREIARTLGDDVVEVRPSPPDRLEAEIRAALDRGADIIGVAGGDGSLRTAASVLAGTDAALLCIPTGTLNHFARRIGIPDLDAAARALRERRIDTLPVGTVQDAVFLNTLTFGEYSRIVRIRERLRRFLGKWPAAVVAFAGALVTMRRITLRLETPGASLVRTTAFVWTGVGWGSFPRVHQALERRSEPDLEVTILRTSGAAATLAFLLRLGARMMRGRQPVRDPALEVLHTGTLVLESRHRLDATADGEVLRLRPPIEVGVRPAALRVLAGPAAATE